MAKSPSAKEGAALDRAQTLICDAWEAATPARQIALARMALGISPLCADAHGLLAQYAKSGSNEELDHLRRGLEAGEAALGRDGFEQYAGGFWGFLETRPYMRARFALAVALWRRGARDEALDHLRAMLTLNPNDNQGVRYTLAAWLVQTDRDGELKALLTSYRGDGTAAWVWTEALAAFRRGGDTAANRKRLAKALAGNTHVAPYLLGERRLPRHMPEFIAIGRDDEAVHYAAEHGEGWRLTPGAVDWLRAAAPPRTRIRPAPQRPRRA